VFVNEKFCKDLEHSKAEDFFFSGLQNLGNTDNPVESNVTTVNVEKNTRSQHSGHIFGSH